MPNKTVHTKNDAFRHEIERFRALDDLNTLINW